MILLVRGEVRGLGEPLVAVGVVAGKGLLTSVSPHVGFQVEIQGESLKTDLALVMSLFGVDQSVSLQLGFIEKLLVASIHSTYELLVLVDHIVLLQLS